MGVKIMGVVSYGPNPCGLYTIFASVPHVVGWINQVTSNCNSKTCQKNSCMTKDKLMPQALQMLGSSYPTGGNHSDTLKKIGMIFWPSGNLTTKACHTTKVKMDHGRFSGHKPL